MEQRKNELLEVVDTFLAFHKRWQDDKTQPDPTTEYFTAIENMFEVWASGAIPAECRGELKLAVDALERELDTLDRSGMPATTDYIQTEFWEAVEQLEAARNPKPPELEFHLESIQDLAKLENITHEQIAKMYGFYDESDRLRIDWVAQELREPGSIINENWEHPELRRRREERDAIQARREALNATIADPKSTETKSSASKLTDTNSAQDAAHAEQSTTQTEQAACPESSFELWMAGQDPNGTPITTTQAAKMLGRPIGDIENEWREFAEERLEAGAEHVKVGDQQYVPPRDDTSEEAADKETVDEGTADKDPASEHVSGESPNDNASLDINALKARAKELGIGFSGNIKAETLRKKIEAAQEKMSAV